MHLESKIPFASLHQVKDPKPFYNPPYRPRSLYFKGAEFYQSHNQGRDKKYYTYKCRDYACPGSLRFLVDDFYREPKILKAHTSGCRESMKEY